MGGAEVRGWRILLQPKLLPNGIHNLGWTLPDIGHYGRLRFLEIGHLTGQNGLPGEVPLPLVKPFGDQRNASLEVHEADLKAHLELLSLATFQS
jgi:hypothetical protein